MAQGYGRHHQSNFSKLLDCEYSYESKESTREETYEQLQKIRANLRRKNYELKKYLEKVKQEKALSCLGLFHQEIKELSQANQKLREDYEKIYKKNRPSISNYVSNPREELPRTPRSRRSVVSICELDNSFKIKKSEISQSQFFNGRKSLKTLDLQNINPKQFHMRASLKMNELRFRENDQLTERKNQNKFNSSLNLSVFSQNVPMRNSIKYKNRTLYPKQNKNVFVNFVSLMLQEQQEKQKKFANFIQQSQMPYNTHRQEVQMSQLQREVGETYGNIQKLTQMLENFENEIKEMEVSISSVTQMTGELTKVKKDYLLMQEKCKKLGKLQTQVAYKQNKLRKMKQGKQDAETFMPPVSVQMLLRLMGIQENLVTDPYHSKKQLKKVIKGNLEKPCKKRVKIKELLDTIKEGRKKFKELMNAYQSKIKKIERKIVSLKFQQGKKE